MMDPRQSYDLVPPPRVTFQDIVESLKLIGLRQGDRVLVHASLSSMGMVDGGAGGAIDALLAVIGGSGTLMMPRYTNYRSITEPFDRRNPPATYTGVIADTLRQRPGAVMSLHPTHPVVAYGPDAEALTCEHYRVSPVGKDSPIDRIARRGGKVLLLGVNHRSNTTIHTGEAYAGVAYWGMPRPDRPEALSIIDENGKERLIRLAEIPGDAYGFNRIEPALVERRIITFGRAGRAIVELMEGEALIKAVAAFLEHEPDGLLCQRPDCFPCRQARDYLLKR